jgi:fibronectin-binding autotransporter adhesin
MKTNSLILRCSVAFALLALAMLNSSAADRWWDGGNTNIATVGDGASTPIAGTWNTTTNNWDQGAGLPHTNWVNANLDNAIFGGAPAATRAVTNGAPITVNQIQILGGGVGTSANRYDIGATTTNINPITFGGSYSTNFPAILFAAGSGNMNFNSMITGTINGGLVVSNGSNGTDPTSGRFLLANTNNNFSGNIVWMGGNLSLPANNPPNYGNPTNKLILAGGSLFVSGAFTNIFFGRDIIVASDSGINMNPTIATSSLTLSNLAITGSATLNRYNASTSSELRFNCDMSGFTGLVDNKLGVMVIQTTVPSAGGWRISGGTLKLNAADDTHIANGAGKTNLIMNGGALNMNGKNETINGLEGGSGFVQNDLSATNSVLTLGDSDATASFGGTIRNNSTGTGTLTVTKIGNGTQTLAGTNQCAGYTISAGILAIGDGATDRPLAGNITNNAALTIKVASSLTYTNIITGNGSLAKSNGGVLTLSATNSYTGATDVGAGSLSVLSANTGNGAINVHDGARLVVVASGTSQLQPATLSLADASVATNDFTAVASTSIAPVNASALALNGTITMNITSGTFASGNTYPLIKYTSLSGSGSVATGTYPALPAGSAGYVTNDTTAGQIEFVVTAPPATRVWAGLVDGNWDTATPDWAGSTTYADGNFVRFDDSATIFSVTNIVSPSALPASVVVSNTTTYTLSGNPIAGASAALSKEQSGTLILANTNSYGGGTTVSGGRLQLGDGSARNGVVAGNILDNAVVEFAAPADQTYSGVISGTGALVKSAAGTLTLNATHSYGSGTTISGGTLQLGDGASANGAVNGPITNNAALAIANPNAQTVANVISGSGTVAKSASGALTLSGNNSYSGATTISNGRVNISNSGALGAAAAGTTVNSGAELHLAGSLTVPEPLSLSGNGSGAGALVVDSGASTWTSDLTVGADTLFGATNSVTASSLTIQGMINAGASALTFRPVSGATFTVSSNVTAGSVLLDGSAAGAGCLVLGEANLALTNVTVLKPYPASGTPPFNAGLWARHSNALGTNGTVTLLNTNLIGNSGAMLRLGNNAQIPADVSLTAYCPGTGAAGVGDYRVTFGGDTAGTTNAWNGPITIHGADIGTGTNGLFMVRTDAGLLRFNNNIVADGVLRFLFRGLGATHDVNGSVTLAGSSFMDVISDSGTTVVNLNATGNSWRELHIAAARVNVGVENALPVVAPVLFYNAPGQLDLNGFNQQIGGLYSTAAGTVVNGSTNTDSTLKLQSAISSNWVFTGTIANVPGAKALNLDVAGSDPLTLTSSGNSYAGSTTIRTGTTLFLTGSGNISASTPMNVQSGGTFDVSGRTGGAFTLTSGRTLMGNGTVNGIVSNDVGSVLSPGASIGTLTVTSNLLIAGDLFFEVNTALSPSNDVLSVGGAITNFGNGTLTVSNLGPALAVGDKFFLFGGKLVAGGSTLSVVPSAGSSVVWSNKLDQDGSIEVLSTGAASSIADLANLVVTPPGVLSPAFVSNTVSYTTTEAYGNSPITVTPYAADATASLQIIYPAGVTNLATNGLASVPLTLDANPLVLNIVIVHVTAQDATTTKDYEVDVTRLPSTTPPTLSQGYSGGSLTLSWPLDYSGYTLQSQTNSRSIGLTNVWYPVAGSDTTNTMTFPVSPLDPTVFFRLYHP